MITSLKSITCAGGLVTAGTGLHYIDDEVVTGPSWQLANIPLTGTILLFKNGLLQREGSGNDYTLGIYGDSFNWNAGATPTGADEVRASYKYV